MSICIALLHSFSGSVLEMASETRESWHSDSQGLTLVQFSTQLKHYLRATPVQIPAGREQFLLDVVVISIDKTSQVELRSGRFTWLQ
jgi:hypothetical protein